MRGRLGEWEKGRMTKDKRQKLKVLSKDQFSLPRFIEEMERGQG
jgi:hypothetical protein